MYAALDLKNRKIIALHDEKRVVERYIDSIEKCHGEKLSISKIKKKYLNKKIDDLYDLYLVRYGDTYVQSGYMEYIELMDPQVEYDHQYAKDVILKILELESLDKEDRKTLESTVMILESIIDQDRKYTPSISELEKIKDQYAPYIYNKYL